MNHNGTEYYYLRNGQGDIVKLIDGSGSTVVEYSYNSWGEQTGCVGTLSTVLGTLNPFRYRGYVYDEETQLYYPQSRNYDPSLCRFISSDVLLSTGQGVLGHNSFAYCGNSPVLYCDTNGMSLHMATEKEIGGSANTIQESTEASSPYIDDQNAESIADLPFGTKGNVGANGCGLVAFYNSLLTNGYDIPFKYVHSAIQMIVSGTRSTGIFGTNPLLMDSVLQTVYGIGSVSPFGFSSKKSYNTYIFLYAWHNEQETDIRKRYGAHYVEAHRDGTGYRLHNDGENAANVYFSKKSDLFKHIISESDFAFCWGIK